jgi:hypothetical protein
MEWLMALVVLVIIVGIPIYFSEEDIIDSIKSLLTGAGFYIVIMVALLLAYGVIHWLFGGIGSSPPIDYSDVTPRI